MRYMSSQVRAWVEQTAEPRRARVRRPSDSFLVFDTETTIDETQRLRFGSFTYGAYIHGQCIPCGEGLIYADDLPDTDPDGFAILKRYTARRPPRVEMLTEVSHVNVNPRLILVSRSEFLANYFYRMADGTRVSPDQTPATIVGFNLPFDISRIAGDVVPSRGARFRNGLSFELLPGRGSSNVRIAKMGAKGHLISLAGNVDSRKGRRRQSDGVFVDVATLVFALTGNPMSLATAGKRFSIAHPKDESAQEYGVISDSHIGYCRDDVRATMELYETAMTELYTHDIDLPEHLAYSPASIAKAYLEKMGVRRPLEKATDFPQEVLGFTTSAFYGGRSEVRIRRAPVPAVLCDFTSMYPTVNVLMGNWRLLTADHIECREETSNVQFMLDNTTTDTAFDPANWRGYVGVARLKPNGDVVPIRADYSGQGGAQTIGLNHAYSNESRWYSIPDLVASAVITGKAPQIELAYRFYPSAETTALLPVSVRGVPLDPRTEDFFVYLIEKRTELKAAHRNVCARFRDTESCDCEESNQIEFLKVLANSGSYGVFVEMNREEYDDPQDRVIYGIGDDSWSMRVDRPERAGQYCFPPIGVVITSGARLMLALLERCVTDAGGLWAFCDTDSMCIVASADGKPIRDPNGKTIPVLTFAQVERIRSRFDALNPYGRTKVPTLLKREYPKSYDDSPLLAYCISAKRYALFQHDGESVTIVKRTEHGLGAFLNPHNPAEKDKRGTRKWVDDIWQYLIETDLGLRSCDDQPEWFERPAMMRRTISTWNVYRALESWNDGKAYPDRIKPYNFHLIASVSRFSNRDDGCYVAPFETDASQWLTMEWHNLHNPQGGSYTLKCDRVNQWVDLNQDGTQRQVVAESYADIVGRYRTHAESKYAGSDGKVCGPSTKGQLYRQHIRLAGVEYIGKESNSLESRAVDSEESAPNSYGSGIDDFRSLVVPVLRTLSCESVAKRTGCIAHRITISRILTGPASGRTQLNRKLTYIAVDEARSQLGMNERLTSGRRTANYRNWRAILTQWADTLDTPPSDLPILPTLAP